MREGARSGWELSPEDKSRTAPAAPPPRPLGSTAEREASSGLWLLGHLQMRVQPAKLRPQPCRPTSAPPSLPPPFFPTTLTCQALGLFRPACPSHSRPPTHFSRMASAQDPRRAARVKGFQTRKEAALRQSLLLPGSASLGVRTPRPLSWCEPQWGCTSGHCSPPGSKGAASLGTGVLGGNLTGPLCQRRLLTPAGSVRAQQEELPTAPQAPRSSFRVPEKRSQGSGLAAREPGGPSRPGKGLLSPLAPISFAHPSLDELPSSWLGSWSQGPPLHTQAHPNPMCKAQVPPRSSGCSPRGEPETLLTRPPGGLRLRGPHQPASGGPWGSVGSRFCAYEQCVCGGGGLRPHPPPLDSRAQPSSLTFKSTNPRDSAWPGTALRTEADARSSPAPLVGAGPRGRSPEADGSRSGAAPPPRPPQRGSASGSMASPAGTFPVIHSVGCRPGLCPGLA